MKIKTRKYIPVIQDGKHVFRKAMFNDVYMREGSQDVFRCININGTNESVYIYTVEIKEEEIPDPPTRKKLCVEIEYNLYRSDDPLLPHQIVNTINSWIPDLQTTVKEIEPGWTDEDMIEFASRSLKNGNMYFREFKKERNK